MTIRRSTLSDLPRILEIYSRARDFMRSSGNPTQWGDSRPAESSVRGDIERGVGYVVEHGGEIVGVFAFIIGLDPTYERIDGEWLNDEPYGTVHRIASSGEVRGVFSACLDFCFSLMPNIRIDTHCNNAPMRHLLKKHGFTECGTIWTDDGTPRMAFQKCSRASRTI